MNNFENFSPLKYSHFWCQKIIPLVYDNSLSYYEQLCKFQETLNQVITNVNNIPDFIYEFIKELLVNGELKKVFFDLISSYMLNVKTPPDGLEPAVGDGSADDTVAIQNVLNYAFEKGYNAVYFPPGKYLTGTLELKDNVSIYGNDRYSTSLIAKSGIENFFIGGDVSNITISNILISGNIGNQVNDITSLLLNGTNFLLSNLIISEGNVGLSIDSTSGHIQCDNIIFTQNTIYHAVLSGNGSISSNEIYFESISKALGDCGLLSSLNNGYYEIIFNGSLPVGVKCTGNNNQFLLGNNSNIEPYSDSGNNNSWNVYGDKQVFSSKDVVINSQNPLTYDSPENGYVEITSYTNNQIYKIPTVIGFIPSAFFGIIGNKTDETSKLQSALNFCAQFGYTLLIEKNKTVGFKTIIIPTGMKICVEGWLWPLDDGFGSFQTIDGNSYPGYSGKHDILITGFGGINGDGLTPNVAEATPFRFYHAQNIVIENITIKNWPAYHAIELGGCKNVEINNVKFLGQYETNETKNYPIEAIQIEACDQESGQSGALPYDHTPCDTINITGCYFGKSPEHDINCKLGIGGHASGTEVNNHKRITIDGCVFDGLTFGAIQPFMWEGCNITNCQARDLGYGFLQIENLNAWGLINATVSNNNCIDICQTPNIATHWAFEIGHSNSVLFVGNNVSGCKNGLLAMANSAQIYFISNDCEYLMQYNVEQKQDVLSMFYMNGCQDVVICNNILYVSTNDTYSSSLNAANYQVPGLVFSENKVNLKINYRTNNSQLISDTPVVIYSGTAYLGTFNLSSDVLNIEYLEVTVTGSNGTSWKIMLNKNDLGVTINESCTSIGATPNASRFYEIAFNIGTSTFTVSKGAQMYYTESGERQVEIGTSDYAPISITKIIGFYNKNNLGFSSAL